MRKKVFQLLVDNTSGVLSRISGLFSRRGYNIESITAGVTADPRFTRITIVASGDDEILEQIENLFVIISSSKRNVNLKHFSILKPYIAKALHFLIGSLHFHSILIRPAFLSWPPPQC